MTISGAYGRDYKSKAEIVKDLNEGKDFIARGLDSGYVNIDDLREKGLPNVTVRYKADRSVTIIKIGREGARA